MQAGNDKCFACFNLATNTFTNAALRAQCDQRRRWGFAIALL
jgi:hypothetical protein